MTTKGKYTALEAEAIDPLVELVSDPDSEVRTYALKVAFRKAVLKISWKLLLLYLFEASQAVYPNSKFLPI